jgi:hypothetical protein
MNAGALLYVCGGRSAANADVLMPMAMRPIVPSKNFFIEILFPASLFRSSSSLCPQRRSCPVGSSPQALVIEADRQRRSNSCFQYTRFRRKGRLWNATLTYRMHPPGGWQVGDSSGVSAKRMELCGRWHLSRPDHRTPVPSSRSQIRLLGTKLEHDARRCYMWITLRSPGCQDR